MLVKGKKSGRYFLVIQPAEKRADFKKIGEAVGDKRVSFASSEALFEKLGLEPGAVSPFGLLNDSNHEVEVYIDQEVYYAKIVSFHPNRNTATLELSGAMFRKYLEAIDNTIKVNDL